MAIAERAVGDVILIAVTGDLTADSETAVQLREAVRHLLQLGHRKVVLDLAGAAHLDSCGLGEIVHAYASARNRGGTLRLLHPSRRIRELLAITKLQTVLECCDDEAEALAESPSRLD